MDFTYELDSNEDLDSQISQIIDGIDLNTPPSTDFRDSRFPPSEKSILSNKNPRKELIKDVNSWERVTHIIKDPELFVNGVEPGDVIQGSLGDCWYLSALSIVAITPSILNHLFMDQYIGSTRFTLRFWIDGHWKYVTIDNHLPINKDHDLVFARCKDKREMWVPLAEKAFAKVFGSYQAIEWGWSQEALVNLTGGVGYRIDVTPQDSTSDDLWDTLQLGNSPDYLMGCTIIGNKMELKGDEYQESGLLVGHAYGVMKCVIVNHHRLVQIRNPYGKFPEWKGDWSDTSHLWDSVSLKDKMRIGYLIDEDGTFFMSYLDFCNYWTSLEVCKIYYKNEYLKQMSNGEFSVKLKTSGGYKIPLECPQYLFDLQGIKPCTVCISLLQSDKRLPSNHKTSNICIGFRIFKGETVQDGSVKYWKQVSKFLYEREVMMELQMEPGRYVIVPSVYREGMESKFWIRVYSQNLMTLTQIHPIPDPLDPIYQHHCELNASIKEEFINRDIPRVLQKYISFKKDLQEWDKPYVWTQDLSSDTAITYSTKELYTRGSHYFKATLKKSDRPGNIMIGVIDPQVQSNSGTYLCNGTKGWGYYSYDGAAYFRFQSKNYGCVFGEGDVIGIWISIETGELEFFYNGKMLGTCFIGLTGPLAPAVTLYHPGDQVVLELGGYKPRNLTKFQTGEKFFIRSKYRHFLGIDESGQIFAFDSSVSDTLFTAQVEDDEFIYFVNEKGRKISLKGDQPTKFQVQDFYSFARNEKSLELMDGTFVGMGQNGKIESLKNTLLYDSRWKFISLNDNPVFKILTNGSILTLKGYFGAYLNFDGEKMGSSKNCTDTNQFLVEKDKDRSMYRLKTLQGIILQFEDNEWLFVTQNQLGYTFELGLTGKYLGITEDGVFQIYNHFFSFRQTRFHPQVLSI